MSAAIAQMGGNLCGMLWRRYPFLLFATRLRACFFGSRGTDRRRHPSAWKTSLKGGIEMKIVLLRSPALLAPFLRKFLGIKKK